MRQPLYLLLLLLSACADPYRNLYEGAQQREAIANPHAQPGVPPVPYEQYKTERERLSVPGKPDAAGTASRPSN